MTVRELIVQLMNQDLDKEVILNMTRNELANSKAVLLVYPVRVLAFEDGTHTDIEDYDYENPDMYELGEGESFKDVVNLSS